MTDFRKGQNYMRDFVMGMCIGFQNEIFNETDNKVEKAQYEAYQKVIDTLEKQYGKLMSIGRED